MKHYDYYKPKTLNDAWALADKIPDAQFIAGGTDMMVRLKNRQITPGALISLRAINDLSGVSVNGATRIGALTTFTELITHPELQRQYPILIDAARKVGSPQVRNAGTIGGNICNASPCADGSLGLLVLDATVKVQQRENAREVALCDFFTGPKATCLEPGEVVTEVTIPKPPANARGVFFKKGRARLDLSIASVAVMLELDGDVCQKARLAAGSCAPVSLRLTEVETLFEGNKITEDLLAEGVRLSREAVSPICDIRSTDDYRRHIVGVYVERAVRTLLGWSKSS